MSKSPSLIQNNFYLDTHKREAFHDSVTSFTTQRQERQAKNNPKSAPERLLFLQAKKFGEHEQKAVELYTHTQDAAPDTNIQQITATMNEKAAEN